jgi:hypothetical protein|nr:MAG TPA: hypothetical protein [Inoviridae sp.]
MKLEITNDTFFEFLADFETADSAYLAAQDAMCNSIEVDDDEWNALKSACESARSNREHYAVVLSRFLVSVKGWISFEADVPADAPVDTSVDFPANALVDSPADALADVLVDVLADLPADAPADVSEDIFPVMSAKCKLCPSCVDGRCFFVPDVYDSIFPCLSPAWDDFFKNVGSRSPAPSARASPGDKPLSD